jgi:RNA polymerase sigma factor (sigma-70 family)
MRAVSEESARSARFVPTRWSLVSRAASHDGSARAALEDLCAAYWYPLYAFARRSGSSPEDAEDVVQSFFATLLEKEWLAQADPERGRFRTFLLAAFRHHASHVRERGRAQKRGGGRIPVPLDDAEVRYAREPADRLTAEALYERRYALILLERAWTRVAERYREGGDAKAERFEALRPCVEGRDHAPYREIGERLGLGETAVKVAVHRLRGRFRESLRREVRDTIEDPAEVDAEIQGLLQALGHGA